MIDRIALLVACAALWMAWPNQSHATNEPTIQPQISRLWIAVKKIEALVTLMQAEHRQENQNAKFDGGGIPQSEVPMSIPLRDEHFDRATFGDRKTIVPIQNISQVSQPSPPPSVPGMEPARQPTISTPIARPPAAVGHWESRGFRGRRSVWISEQAGYQSGGGELGSRPILGAPVRAGRRVLGFCFGGRCG